MRIIAPILLGLFLSASVLAQEAITETRKIDEFGRVNCCDFGARVDFAAITQRENPGSQVHVIFYSGRKYKSVRTNRRSGKDETFLINPMRGEFSDFAAGFRMRAAFQKVDMNNFVIIDGGYREYMGVEIWLVPAGSAAPKVTPTVDQKIIRYRKGIPHGFRRICYET